ncbi:hypothetical protein [Streptomyces sp. NPDC048636]|uniref:hypothetical protein n=1 Tax=Streptomyces sp. NPDC048636 TaxID=3155762 RepID=UPI0034187AA1
MPLDVHAAMRAMMRAEAARCPSAPANAAPPPPPAIDPDEPMIDPPAPTGDPRPVTAAVSAPANAPRRRPPRPHRWRTLPRALRRVWSFPLVRSGPAGDR